MVRYFVAKGLGRESVYMLSGQEVVQIGVPAIRFPLAGMDPKSAIEAQEKITASHLAGTIRIEETDLKFGTFYPCVAKPLFDGSGKSLFLPNTGVDAKLAKAIWRELDVVKQDLEKCFDVNAIEERNFSAFGTRYEQIIYFCCIGVEGLFRRVLEASNALAGRTSPKQYSMNDFVRLKPLLRIDEVGLSLVRYPWIDELRPF